MASVLVPVARAELTTFGDLLDAVHGLALDGCSRIGARPCGTCGGGWSAVRASKLKFLAFNV